MIFPECTDEFMEGIVSDIYDLPEQYDAYSSLDPGATDYTGFLTAYYDFMRAKVVIVGEHFAPHESTDLLAQRIREIEGEHFGGHTIRRVCDNHDKILINDLARMHSLFFVPTQKDTLEAMVNFTRVQLRSGRVEIVGCEQLVRQMKTGLFNKQGTKFDVGAREGHYDLLAALIYLLRIVNYRANPFKGIHKSVKKDDLIVDGKRASAYTDFDGTDTIKNVLGL